MLEKSGTISNTLSVLTDSQPLFAAKVIGWKQCLASHRKQFSLTSPPKCSRKCAKSRRTPYVADGAPLLAPSQKNLLMSLAGTSMGHLSAWFALRTKAASSELNR
jgi:hypothetical protein